MITLVEDVLPEPGITQHSKPFIYICILDSMCVVVMLLLLLLYFLLGAPQNSTAIVHAGGELFLRTVYGGQKFSNHRVHVLE